jgi:hypothetical protein
MHSMDLIRLVWCIFIFNCLIGCGASRSIPFNIDGNRPILIGKINGEVCNVLIDTGLTDSCGISEDLANKLGLKRSDVMGTVTYGDGGKGKALFSNDNVIIDFGDLTITVKNPVIFLNVNNSSIAFGTQCLVQSKAVIDYGNNTIVFHGQ